MEIVGVSSARVPALGHSRSGLVVAKIESLLEAVLRQLLQNNPASLPLAVKRRNTFSLEQVNFPGNSCREAKKFTRLVLILQLSHDTLVSGIVLTKRNIFYQHRQLFDSQSQVDELVDAVAWTLDVTRDELNIVATSKGLICGAASARLDSGASLDLSTGESGSIIPIHNTIRHLDLTRVKWVLIVEKDAVFRTLVSHRYWQCSKQGPGLLVTAKGYPDLNTREFLRVAHSRSPHLPMFVLADCDTDGLNIVRYYRYELDASSGTTKINHAIRWLGIKTSHLLALATEGRGESWGQTASEDISTRVPMTSTACREPTTDLTDRDRKVAVKVLGTLDTEVQDDPEASGLKSELQSLLMLGVKSEIQWLDDGGDISGWLDCELAKAMQ